MSDLRWHAADGSEHIQATLAKLKGTCGCGLRHKLAGAASTRICPGVAHTWANGVACVLCGLAWRVPIWFAVPVERAAPRCIYCTSLARHPDALAKHRSMMHQEEICPAPVD